MIFCNTMYYIEFYVFRCKIYPNDTICSQIGYNCTQNQWSINGQSMVNNFCYIFLSQKLILIKK